VALEHALLHCEQRDVGIGLLWLVRGLELAARAEAADLQWAIRANLAGWLPRLRDFRATLPHEGRVLAAAYSPDGTTIPTGCDDSIARFWDAATGARVGPRLRHDNGVTAVAFTPDGARVLTGSHDQTARLWDAATGEPVGEPLRHPAFVLAVAVSPDGRTVATGCADGRARLWDVATGQVRGEPLRHGGAVNAVAFSPDGRTALTGSWDHTARVRPVPEPLPDDIDHLIGRIQTLTGLTLEQDLVQGQGTSRPEPR
jgi:hypothetical protein